MNQTLIKILADGQFHSGEALGQALGVTRAAVWKQLHKLEEMNIPLHSIKGKGYRLPEAVELLDLDRLQQAGLPLSDFDKTDIFLSLDSTNDEMMRRASQAEPLGKQLCFAEMQTSGRGRRGRQWLSPFSRNLYFSMLWPFEGIAAMQGLSLAVGLAVYRVLKPMEIEGLGLKWPNDILVGNKKLGGILIELTGDVTDACQGVIGVGLNFDWRNQDQAHIEQEATGLVQVLPSSYPFSRNEITARLITELVNVLKQFAVDGFAVLQEEWNQANGFAEQEVDVILPSSVVSGTCKGVNEKGELVIQTEDGEHVFNAGEVSLRRVIA